MADPVFLRELAKGSAHWNEWIKGKRGDRSEIDLSDVCLRNASLRAVDLRFAKLVDADLQSADLEGANLANCSLDRADLSFATLIGADFSGTSLIDANLESVFAVGANFTGAHLAGAQFFGAVLAHANLTSTVLFNVDFTNSVLVRARFAHAHFSFTRLCNLDIRHVAGLDEAKHTGPSFVGVETIYKSNAEISHKFLRQAGIPEDFIVYMKSLVNSPIGYYSCFISYSTVDSDFTERLYADLQARHVRCWFAPEDLKIGERFRSGIDEAIRVNDKLLLVLSEQSVQSRWVEKEVETAFEKERRSGRVVLFPIRLDDAVMDTNVAWAADIRRTRHIGNFHRWKEHEEYSRAFDRLMRDLKADGRNEGTK